MTVSNAFDPMESLRKCQPAPQAGDYHVYRPLSNIIGHIGVGIFGRPRFAFRGLHSCPGSPEREQLIEPFRIVVLQSQPDTAEDQSDNVGCKLAGHTACRERPGPDRFPQDVGLFAKYRESASAPIDRSTSTKRYRSQP
jgi:hypothetical protein